MTPPSQDVKPTSMVVTTSGGQVATSDGNLAVTIPAGALGQNVKITVEGAELAATGNVGAVYEIGPTGTQFAIPVTLKLRYAMADLDGAPESSLRVATFAAGAWQILPGAVVDTQAKTVSGVTSHLSPYAIVVESAGKTCASVSGGTICSAPDATVGGSGAAPMCMPTTCADASDACHAYPGSTRDSCTDGDKGYAATCCFAPQAPICFAVSAAGGGCANSTNGPGAVTCGEIPRCATASNACAAYPGATLQGCTDNATGYSGGCCFPPAAPVCVAVTVDRGCGTTNAAGGAAECQAPPRCEDANPCANYAGGTAQSCTNTANGYTATCCFAGGTLPVSSGPRTSGAGATTGSGGGTGGAGTVDPGAGGNTGTGARTGTGGGASGGTIGGGGVTGTGGGGASSGGTSGGGASSGTGGSVVDPAGCVPDGVCQPGQTCGNASPDSCVECGCSASGHFVCKSCPTGTGTGGAAGGSGGAAGGGGISGGSGGTIGGVPTTCEPGATCDPGQRCGAKTNDSCIECACGANGQLVCNPCADPGSGGTAGTGASTGSGATNGGGGTTGGVPAVCEPGATCDLDQRCAAKTADSCIECACGANGQLVCNPCGAPGTGGNTGAGATAGGGTGGTGGTTGGAPAACEPGATCDPGQRCGAKTADSCIECACGANGQLVCNTCGDPGTGGATGTGGTTGGSTSGPCQMMPRPWTGGTAPCSVSEICPDGNDYAVTCDGSTSACTCMKDGTPIASAPVISCAEFNDLNALTACGFPAGKI